MIEWLYHAIETTQEENIQRAQNWQNELTKPPGSLGILEAISVNIAALQKTLNPSVDNAQIVIYAADHGIAQEKVSAFPQAVTAEMVKNFSSGGAAICALSRQHQLPLQVINLGLVSKLPAMDFVEHHVIAAGTQNFLRQSAMTERQLCEAFNIAKEKVDQAKNNGCELLIAGEMGIANTSSATALVCALKSIKPGLLTGSGTGLDENGVQHKARVIQAALEKHKDGLNAALEILQVLGGFEIAALTATYIRCAQKGIVCLVDGFISSVAALMAVDISPDCKDWMIFSHQSAEQGHITVLELIEAKPLLQFNMRLGEGSGAVLAYPLIRSACLLHNEMASFSSASVSKKISQNV